MPTYTLNFRMSLKSFNKVKNKSKENKRKDNKNIFGDLKSKNHLYFDFYYKDFCDCNLFFYLAFYCKKNQ